METKSSPQDLPQDIRTALQEHDAVLRLSYIAIVTGVNLLLRQGIPKEVISQVVTQAIEALSKDFHAPTHQDFCSGMETPPDAFTTDESSLREPSQAAVAVEEPVLAPEKGSDATVPECGERSVSAEDRNVSACLNDLMPALIEGKQNERAPGLGSIVFPPDSGAQLIAEMKRNLPAVSSSPALHLMPPRGGNDPSSGTKSIHMSAPGNRALSLDTMNRIPRGPRRSSIHALLPSLEAWRTRCETVLLRTISPATWSRVYAAAVRRIRQPIYPAQILQRWIFEFKRDWMAMINAMALPEMKRSFLRWLRRPIHSNLWRQARASPLEARRDLHP
jgi:hypothetical protein